MKNLSLAIKINNLENVLIFIHNNIYKSFVKMASEDVIKSLQEAIKKDDHNQVYEYSKMLLKESPEDEDYLQTFIISALKINVLEELTPIFKTSPTNQSIKKLYAYYLYHCGQYEKSIKFIKGVKKGDEYNLLQAQIYFKLNQCQASSQLMKSLLNNNKLEQQDRQMYLINLFATGMNKNLNKQTILSYKNLLNQKGCRQIFYNYGLLLVQMKQYQLGFQSLNKFQALLVKGQDDLDIQTVRILKDYVAYHIKKEGYKKSLIGQYEKIEEETKDINLQQVIENNLIFLNGNHIQNVHQTLRFFDQALEKKSKMTKYQSYFLKMNKLTTLLRKNRFLQGLKLLKDIEANYSVQDLLLSIDYIKNKYFLLKKTKDANKQTDINSFIQTVQKINPNLSFCLYSDYKKENNEESELIGQLKQTNHKSIVKNYLFSLLIKNPNLFQQYHEYLQSLLTKTNDAKILDILLKLYENKKNVQKQKIVLNKILMLNGKDTDSKIKLAQLYVNEGNFVEAQQLLKGIQGPQEINDINYLQHIERNIHISIIKQEPTHTLTQNQQNAVKKQTKKKIKKKRKLRLPKNLEKFVEGFKGDPERWLPKWQRKGYKKKGKKGGGKTQGLATINKEETKNVFTTGASTSSKEVTKDTTKKRK